MVMRHYRPTIINSLILLIIALCFGSTFLFIFLSLADFNPLATGSGRIIVAGICSIVFLYASGNKLPNTLELWSYATIYGIFCLTIPFILIPFALRNLTTGEVAIYLSSIPLFILVLAKFILKEKISAKRWLGFFTGVLGLIFLVISSQNSTIDFSSNLLSALLCILASILLATGGILIQKMPKYSPISLTGASLTVASILAIPIFLINVPEDIPQPIPLIGLFGVGIFSTFLGNTLRFILIRRTNAVFTSINGFIAPIIASILGIVLLTEQITFGTILSYLIIISGVFIAQDMDKHIYNLVMKDKKI